VKLRILLLAVVGVVGGGASYALADGGHDGQAGTNASCRRAHVAGTVAAPQTLTVTVAKSGEGSPFTAGQVVTVSVGSAGQIVRVNVEGCVSGSSLTGKEAELHAVSPSSGHDTNGHDGDTPESTAETTTTTAAGK
jgi:hypothetical protein